MHQSPRTMVVLTAVLALTVGATAITVAVASAHDAASVPAVTQHVAGDAGAALPPSYPVAIDIPAIGVRSPLQHVGLTDERTMQVPAPGPHYDQAAWYKHSVGPGSPGPAIIVGHVDSATGAIGAPLSSTVSCSRRARPPFPPSSSTRTCDGERNAYDDSWRVHGRFPTA